MNIPPIYLETIFVVVGVGFAGVSYLCPKDNGTRFRVRQTVVSCGLALIFLAGLVPEVRTQFGVYDLFLVAFFIAISGTRVFIYGRELRK